MTFYNTLTELTFHPQCDSVCVCQYVASLPSHETEYRFKVCALSLQPPDKFLLPEVSIADYGKNCVVIDLDETLVHSSFKVYHTHTHKPTH